MQRYVPLARARARRLNLIEFLPPTTAPFTATATMQAASLFLLASVPFVAAQHAQRELYGSDDEYVGARPHSSQGACHDTITDTVQCFHPAATGTSGPTTHLHESDCQATGNVWYALGSLHPTTGCCMCESNCDHSLETAAAGTCNYADTNAGSCKYAVTGKVTCDMLQSECKSPNVWSAAGALDSDGCCFCDETCDHTAETGTDCAKGPYADLPQEDGSCYDMTTHVIECDVSLQACVDAGRYWYSPGYITSRSGCCYCEAQCDHSLEVPVVQTMIPGYNCDASIAGDCDPLDWTVLGCSAYYTHESRGGAAAGGHGLKYTFAPTAKPVAIDAAAATTVGVLAAGAAGAAALL